MLANKIVCPGWTFPPIQYNDLLLYDYRKIFLPHNESVTKLSNVTLLNSESNPLMPVIASRYVTLTGNVTLSSQRNVLRVGMILAGTLDLNGKAIYGQSGVVYNTTYIPGNPLPYNYGNVVAPATYSLFPYIAFGGSGGYGASCVGNWTRLYGTAGTKGGGGAGGGAHWYYPNSNTHQYAYGGGGGGLIIIIAREVIGSGSFLADATGPSVNGGGAGGGSINIFAHKWSVSSVNISASYSSPVSCSYTGSSNGGGPPASAGTYGNAALWKFSNDGELTLMAATANSGYSRAGTGWPTNPVNGANFNTNF